MDNIKFKEAIKNIYNRLHLQPQPSLLTIGWEIEDERLKKGLDIHDVSELKD